MNPFNRPTDYTYSMNMNFPSLNQANPPTDFRGTLGQNLNMQKSGNMPTHPSQGSYQEQMYKMSNAALQQQRQSLASKGLSSQSNAFVPCKRPYFLDYFSIDFSKLWKHLWFLSYQSSKRPTTTTFKL